MATSKSSMVEPGARGRGIGKKLVQTLLEEVGRDGPALVSLTTRIPHFFSRFGFKPYGQLVGGSTAILICCPNLLFLSPKSDDD